MVRTRSHHGLDTTTNRSNSQPPQAGHDHQQVKLTDTTGWIRPPTGQLTATTLNTTTNGSTNSHHGLDTTTNGSTHSHHRLDMTTNGPKSQPPWAGHDHQRVELSHHRLDTTTNGSNLQPSLAGHNHQWVELTAITAGHAHDRSKLPLPQAGICSSTIYGWPVNSHRMACKFTSEGQYLYIRPTAIEQACAREARNNRDL